MEWTFAIDWDKDGTFTAENTRLLEIKINRGRDRSFSNSGPQAMRPGTLYAVVDNYDGRYDPYNTAGALYGYLKPGRPIRAHPVENGVTKSAFVGYVTDVRPVSGRDARAVIKASDGLTFLDRQYCDTAATQTNYAVSDALSDLLSQAQWPLIGSAQKFPFNWPMILGGTTIPDNGDTIDSWTPAATKTILRTMEEIAAAFLGSVYVTASGSLAYKARNSARPTVMTLDQSMIMATDIEPTMPWDEIYSEIRVTPTAGAMQTYSDTAAEYDYGPSTLAMSGNDYIQSAAQALNIVDYLKIYLPALKRGIRIRLQDRFDYQFGLELLDRVSVTMAALGIDSLFQVGSIEHSWRNGGACITTLRMEPDYHSVAGFQVFPFHWPIILGW